MKRKGGRNKPLMNSSMGNTPFKSRTENKKRKLTGSCGRYFGKKIDEVEDDDKAKTNNVTDSSEECDYDMETQSNVEAGKHQDDESDDVNDTGSSDEDSETDGNSRSKKIAGIKCDRHNDAKSNDIDESEGDDDGSDEEGDTGNDDDVSNSGSEEDKESDNKNTNDINNSKTIVSSNKQKKINKSNKQQNGSLLVKKGTKSIQKLPKFQGTTRASEQNQQTDSPSKKRKRPNEDEMESEISPAKKQCFDDKTESSISKRKEERNCRSLFLKNLPPNTTVEMVKKLSPEIINVHIPQERNRKAKFLYAFIEFENEETAEKNYKIITEKTIDGTKFAVDYCGEKSNYYRKPPNEFAFNRKRLFIPSVPLDITPDELKQHFPDAKTLLTKLRGTKRLVFMSFENEAVAKKVFEENEKLKIRGNEITILFAYKKKRPQGAVNPRKNSRRAKFVSSIFEKEDNLDGTKSEPKEKKEQNPQMEIDSNKKLETSTGKSKVKRKRNRNKKFVK